MPIRAIREFMRYEAAAGSLLFAAATVAIILANTALAPLYGHLLDVPLTIRIGAHGLAKPLLLWINDGLMAVFFLLVGLEIEHGAPRGSEIDHALNLAHRNGAAVAIMETCNPLPEDVLIKPRRR